MPSDIGTIMVRRPSWRHPIQRMRWRRRVGRSAAVLRVTMHCDTSEFVNSVQRVDRALHSLSSARARR